jgi:hypothetical protein
MQELPHLLSVTTLLSFPQFLILQYRSNIFLLGHEVPTQCAFGLHEASQVWGTTKMFHPYSASMTKKNILTVLLQLLQFSEVTKWFTISCLIQCKRQKPKHSLSQIYRVYAFQGQIYQSWGGCTVWKTNDLTMESRTCPSQYSGSEDINFETWYLGVEWLNKFWKVWEVSEIHFVYCYHNNA